MNRRTFLGRLGMTAAALAWPVHDSAPAAAGIAIPADWMIEEQDVDIIVARLGLGRSAGWGTLPFAATVAAYGFSFLGTPYLGYSLDDTGAERLIINLQGLDCLTFVETSLALARTLRIGGRGVRQYGQQLTFIRYRGGRRGDYPSRLHYFEDWLEDNAARRHLQLLSADLGGEVLAKAERYMSTHRAEYPVLARDDAALAAISAQEEQINARQRYYIPKERVADVAGDIQSGDILGLTTSRADLLVGHTAMAYRTDDGVLHLLHEPNVGYSATLSALPLADYLMGLPQFTGVMVARPLWPW
jgi:hypothetical protein